MYPRTLKILFELISFGYCETSHGSALQKDDGSEDQTSSKIDDDLLFQASDSIFEDKTSCKCSESSSADELESLDFDADVTGSEVDICDQLKNKQQIRKKGRGMQVKGHRFNIVVGNFEDIFIKLSC